MAPAGLRALGVAGRRGGARSLSRAGRTCSALERGAAARLEPEQLRRQIVFATRSWSSAALARGPLLLVVEDLHWADAASDRAALFRRRSPRRPSAAVPGPSRPGGAAALPTSRGPRKRSSAWPALARPRAGRCVGAALRPARRARLRARPGSSRSAPAATPSISRRSCASLVGERRARARGRPGGCGPDAVPVDVPATLHGLLLSRVDRLPAGGAAPAPGGGGPGPHVRRPLLRAVAADGRSVTRAGAWRRLVEADRSSRWARRGASADIVHPGAGPGGGLPEPPAHAAGRAHERAARRGARPPEARARTRRGTLESARSSLQPGRGQGSRSAATSWRPAIGPAPCTPTTTRSATTSARSGTLARGRRRRRPGTSGRASGWPTPRAHRAARRRPAGITTVARRAAEAADAPARRASAASSAASHWDAGDRDRRPRMLRAGLERLDASGDPIEVATSTRRWAGWRSGAATTRPRSGLGGPGARPAERLTDGRTEPETRRTPRDRAARPQHARASRWRASGGSTRRWPRSSGASRSRRARTCSRRRAAATRTSASSTARWTRARRSRRACSGLEIAQADRRPGLPVVALREPRGRLLRADRPLRGRRDGGRPGRDRPGPAARPARPPGRAPDRARPDLPVPRRARAGRRLLSRGPRPRRAAGEPQLLFPCYDGLATLHLDLGEDGRGRRVSCARPRRCASGPASSPTRSMVLPFLG